MTLSALIVKRLLLGVVIMFFVSALIFAGTEILPGDVAQAILGQGATPELLANVRLRLGLGDPVIVRYWHWLSSVITGDFGTSMVSGADIAGLLSERVSNTAMLAGATALIAVPLSIGLGLLCALKPGGLLDRAISAVSLSLISVPDFLVAIVLVMIFSVNLGWLPAIANLRPDQDALAIVRQMVLPVTVLVFTVLAHMVRMTRSSVINVLSSPATEMAILKGVPRARLLLVHALPNALAPIANVVVLNLAYLISGIVVVETLFNFSGLGRLMVESVSTRDIPVVQVCALLFCAVYVILNLVADVVSVVSNPRLRYPR
ncbi:MAG: peptide/nickel transport system permease protein [Granulosicoccus sp.]|jgi:peptide/nickel transport system permease protein